MSNTQNLCDVDKDKLAKWLGYKKIDATLLFSAVQNSGLNVATFRQLCVNKGQCIVVLYGSTGNVYGIYISIGFNSTGVYQRDDRAFLFLLSENNKKKMLMFPAKIPHFHVYHLSSIGPYFSDQQGGRVCNFFQNQGQAATYNLQAFNTDLFEMNGYTSNQITGGALTVTNIEIYSVAPAGPAMRGLPDDPWRKDVKWDAKMAGTLKQDLLEFKSCLEQVSFTNILLTGPISAGKSSYFNTIASCFRGHVTGQAPTGEAAHSVTTKMRRYGVRAGGSRLKVCICDTMGLEETQGLMAADYPYILDGHVPDNFQFNPLVHISSSSTGFKTLVKLADSMHVVAIVLDSSSLDSLSAQMWDKLRSVQQQIDQRSVPSAVILTGIDKISHHVKESVSTVFYDEEVKDAIDTVASKLGLPRWRIHPVKNYESEVDLDTAVDILAMLSLRQLLRLAEDYFEEKAMNPDFFTSRGGDRDADSKNDI